MIKLLSNKWFHIFPLVCFLIVAAIFSGSENEARKRLQYFVFDSYNKIYERESDNSVVIIDLDEASLRKMGQWPWPRTTVANLIEKLDSMGAKVIAFDMVFAERDRTSPVNIANKLPEQEEYYSAKNILKNLPDNDQILSEAILKSGKVVTGFTSGREGSTLRFPAQPVKPTLIFKDRQRFLDAVYSRGDVTTNLDIISSNAAGNGHFMVQPEIDGIIRRVPLLARVIPIETKKSFSVYPLLSIEALRVGINPNERITVKDILRPTLLEFSQNLRVGNYAVPFDEDSKFWVHYRKIADDEYISAHKVLEDNISQDIKNKVKDKFVFIGTSAEGLKDIRSTALEQYVPGVEVHVNIVEQILQNRFLVRPQTITDLEGFILIISGLMIILIGFYINVFLKALVVSSLLSYLRSEVDRKQVKTAFGHYISPVFMEELTKNPEKLKLGGEVRDLTVMFTDIRGFTKISESLSPEELVQLMNDFLTPMSDLVMESRGTIDKYMGDAMMAFWNAPLDDPEHAKQACLTALSMNKALEPINKKLEKRGVSNNGGILKLSAGIGINTGKCSVGNMGSKQRFAYSALGDAVNLASRLEGQTKTYGVDNLIGEDTYKYVKSFAVMELDIIQVIGREEPVKIYTLIGDEEYADKTQFKKWKAAHNAMLAAYRIADFTCAAQDCKEAKELANGKLEDYYKLYNQRIIEYTKNPPSDEWDGVYVAKTK